LIREIRHLERNNGGKDDFLAEEIVDVDERVLPEINMDLCNGCGTCVDTCPSEAVDLIDGRPVIVHPEDCAYCGDCEDLCPEGAISLPYEIVFAE
jgi:NAD-dependent dihydropyrimidine dehydrogenase PreA subunit